MSRSFYTGDDMYGFSGRFGFPDAPGPLSLLMHDSSFGDDSSPTELHWSHPSFRGCRDLLDPRAHGFPTEDDEEDGPGVAYGLWCGAVSW